MTMSMEGLRASWNRYRTFLLVVIGLPTLATAMLSALLPPQYLATATAIPSNARLTDVNLLASQGPRELYPVFGESDDLDRIHGICKSTTLNGLISARFQLAKHYGLHPDKPVDLAKAQKRLTRNTELLKTENGELKVKVWDKDPAMAADIANAYLALTDSLDRQMVADLHGDALKSLAKPLPPDSLRYGITEIDPTIYTSATSRASLAQRTVPPALMVIDPAMPSLRPDRPDMLLNTLAALLVSGFTAIALLLLFIPQRKQDS